MLNTAFLNLLSYFNKVSSWLIIITRQKILIKYLFLFILCWVLYLGDLYNANYSECFGFFCLFYTWKVLNIGVWCNIFYSSVFSSHWFQKRMASVNPVKCSPECFLKPWMPSQTNQKQVVWLLFLFCSLNYQFALLYDV